MWTVIFFDEHESNLGIQLSISLFPTANFANQTLINRFIYTISSKNEIIYLLVLMFGLLEESLANIELKEKL